MNYYHISNRPLKKTTTLTTGIYGEKVNQWHLLEEDYPKYIQEKLFELKRLEKYPDAPSRFQAVFLFDDLGIARAFHAANGYNGYLYEVEIKEGEPFKAEMNWLSSKVMSVEQVFENAKRYWEQEFKLQSFTTEVLLIGKAEVKKLILEPED